MNADLFMKRPDAVKSEVHDVAGMLKTTTARASPGEKKKHKNK